MNGDNPVWKKALFTALVAAAALMEAWYFLAPIRKSVVAQPWSWWTSFLKLLFG
jgi:hypothetical protein